MRYQAKPVKPGKPRRVQPGIQPGVFMRPPEESGAGGRSIAVHFESSKAARDQTGTPVDSFEVQGESPGANFQGPFKGIAESPKVTVGPGGGGTDSGGRLALCKEQEREASSAA